MFEYRGNRKYCIIHPGTELSYGSIKTKKGLKATLVCRDCDALVEHLKQTESPKDRYLK